MSKNRPISDANAHYFLVTEQVVIGTPDSIQASDRTLDTTVSDLAKNTQLKEVLKLPSSTTMPTPFYATLGRQVPVTERREFFIGYLSDFESDQDLRRVKRAYLESDGRLRILGAPSDSPYVKEGI